MTIRSTPFGPTVLTGKDAARLVQHMHEDPSSAAAKVSLETGRKVLSRLHGTSKATRKEGTTDDEDPRRIPAQSCS